MSTRCAPPRCWPSARAPSATRPTCRRVPAMTVLGRLYHVGIVVPDIEVAQAHLADLLGITWGPVLHVDAYDVRAFDGDGGDGNDLVFPNTLCYSTEPPHLELVQEVPGSVWECNEH